MRLFLARTWLGYFDCVVELFIDLIDFVTDLFFDPFWSPFPWYFDVTTQRKNERKPKEQDTEGYPVFHYELYFVGIAHFDL